MNKTITTAALAATITATGFTAIPAGASETAIPAAMRHTPPCAVSQLHASLSGHKAAMGADRWNLTLTDEGGICTIDGYPRFRLRHPDGTLASTVTIHSPVLGVPDPGPQRVVLADGQAVTAAIGYGDGQNYPAGNVAAGTIDVGLKGEPGWTAIRLDNPVNVYLGAVSTTALTKG